MRGVGAPGGGGGEGVGLVGALGGSEDADGFLLVVVVDDYEDFVVGYGSAVAGVVVPGELDVAGTVVGGGGVLDVGEGAHGHCYVGVVDGVGGIGAGDGVHDVV